MPKSAATLEKNDYLSLLVIGPSGVGKTTLFATLPKPIYVIYSDPDEQKLQPAAAKDPSFIYDLVNDTDGTKLLQNYQLAIATAHRLIRAGEIKSVVHDTFTMFANFLAAAELNASETKAGNEDGRTAYDRVARRLQGAIGQFLALPNVHRVALAHYYPPSGSIDGQKPKEGEGILPGIPGRMRAQIPGHFVDTCLIKKEPDSEKRWLHFSIEGVYGLKSVSRPGVVKIPPDLTAYIENRVANVEASKKALGAPKLPPKTAAQVPPKPQPKPIVKK